MNRGRSASPVEGSKRFHWPILRSRRKFRGTEKSEIERPTGDQAREIRHGERHRARTNERKRDYDGTRCDRRTRIGFRQQLVARNSPSAIEATVGKQRLAASYAK